MYRPKDWPPCPCNGCELNEEDEYGYLCDLGCDKRSAWINFEAGADAMLGALRNNQWCPGDDTWIKANYKGRIVVIPEDK